MRQIPIALFCLSLLLPTGAYAGGKGAPSSQGICNEIERGIPGAHFERESRFRLGRLAVAFIKPVARLALGDDEEARVYLSAIKSVDVATYRVVDMPVDIDADVLRTIESRLLDDGWQKIVRSRDDEDNTWVFFRHRNDGSIRGILVIELDRYELEIVSVAGRMDEVLAQAIAEEPGEFSGLFGS